MIIISLKYNKCFMFLNEKRTINIQLLVKLIIIMLLKILPAVYIHIEIK